MDTRLEAASTQVLRTVSDQATTQSPPPSDASQDFGCWNYHHSTPMPLPNPRTKLHSSSSLSLTCYPRDSLLRSPYESPTRKLTRKTAGKDISGQYQKLPRPYLTSARSFRIIPLAKDRLPTLQCLYGQPLPRPRTRLMKTAALTKVVPFHAELTQAFGLSPSAI